MSPCCKTCRETRASEFYLRNKARCKSCVKLNNSARYHRTKVLKRVPPPRGMGRCTRCKTLKPRGDFGLRAGGRLRSWCRRCEVAYIVEARKADPEKFQERDRRRSTDPVLRAKVAERWHRYYAKNQASLIQRASIRWHKITKPRLRVDSGYAEKHRNTQRRYRRANRARLNALSREANRKNPLRVKYWKARTKATRLHLPNTLTMAQLEWIISELAMTCIYCCAPLVGTRWQIDHLIPFAMMGPNIVTNVVTACADCNNHKKAKHWLRFVRKSFPTRESAIVEFVGRASHEFSVEAPAAFTTCTTSQVRT